MALPMVPDNQEILELLRSHITGPYRVVHHAWVPYVRVGPSTETEIIEIRANAGIRLIQDARRMRLQGLDKTVDFAIMFQGGGVALQELGRQATQLDSIDPQHPLSHRPTRAVGVRKPLRLGKVVAEEQPEGGWPSQEVTVPPQRRQSLVVMDVPKAAVSEAVEALAAAVDLQPALGDYLVLPEGEAERYAPLPPWAVTTGYVDQVHFVKPRLGVSEPIKVT
jgi:hypothetical protein